MYRRAGRGAQGPLSATPVHGLLVPFRQGVRLIVVAAAHPSGSRPPPYGIVEAVVFPSRRAGSDHSQLAVPGFSPVHMDRCADHVPVASLAAGFLARSERWSGASSWVWMVVWGTPLQNSSTRSGNLSQRARKLDIDSTSRQTKNTSQRRRTARDGVKKNTQDGKKDNAQTGPTKRHEKSREVQKAEQNPAPEKSRGRWTPQRHRCVS